MTPEQRRARAYAARALMDDPTLQAGWAELEADLRAAWDTSGPSWIPACRRKREGIWIELKQLRALRGKLANFAGQARD